MPRRKHERHGEMPLPDGWQFGTDTNGKVFYINHNTKQTTWLDPRDRGTKPETFADCTDDELPYGWEQAYDKKVGIYFIDHVNQCNQIEDPRQQWKEKQQKMLAEYVKHAQQNLETKREMYDLKQQRLHIANEEVSHLKDTLATCKSTSRTSLTSVYSAGGTKYDPDLLRNDVRLAKERVSRLQGELQHIRDDMRYKEMGVQTLAQVEQKFGDQNSSSYSVERAHEVLHQIQDNTRSYVQGQQEKQAIMQKLSQLRDEYLSLRDQTGGSSSDVSTSSYVPEQVTMSSQTDLHSEASAVIRYEEYVRMSLQYDETMKEIAKLQEELAQVQAQVLPGQNQTDKERLLLIQEKDQLLRELQSINVGTKSEVDMLQIKRQIAILKTELYDAKQISSQQIAERLRLNTHRKNLTQRLEEKSQLAFSLQSHLKSMSSSTLSISSGSSRGSLGSLSASTGSKSSLASLATDIYMHQPYGSDGSLQNLHMQVEKMLSRHRDVALTQDPLLSASQSTMDSSVGNLAPIGEDEVYSTGNPVSPCISAGPPPSYEQHIERHQQSLSQPLPRLDPQNLSDKLNELTLAHPSSHSYSDCLVSNNQYYTTDVDYSSPASSSVPPLSSSSTSSVLPSSAMLNTSMDLLLSSSASSSSMLSYSPKFSSPSCDNNELSTSTGALSNPPLSPISETSSGVDTSVAGHNASSGVNTRSVSAAVSNESVTGDSGVFEASKKGLDETLQLGSHMAQIQVTMKYENAEGKLHLRIDQTKNLSALVLTTTHRIQMRVSLLPMNGPAVQFCSAPCVDIGNPKFDDVFRIPIPVGLLVSKVIQIHVWSLSEDKHEDCLGCAQVSLSTFNTKHSCSSWYNILSFKFMQSDSATIGGIPTTTIISNMASSSTSMSTVVTNTAAATITSSTTAPPLQLPPQPHHLTSTQSAYTAATSTLHNAGATTTTMSATTIADTAATITTASSILAPSSNPLTSSLALLPAPSLNSCMNSATTASNKKPGIIAALINDSTTQQQADLLAVSGSEVNEKLTNFLHASVQGSSTCGGSPLSPRHRKTSKSTEDTSTAGRRVTMTAEHPNYLHLHHPIASSVTANSTKESCNSRMRSLSFDSSCLKSSMSACKEESSDDSTIISSQASTLTRGAQGIGDYADQTGITDHTMPSSALLPVNNPLYCDSSAAGSDSDSSDLPSSSTHTVSLSSDSDISSDITSTSSLSLSPQHHRPSNHCDKQTNTSELHRHSNYNPTTTNAGISSRTPHQPHTLPGNGSNSGARAGRQERHVAASDPPSRVSALRRSQTFSPANQSETTDYVCKLNRSGSDSNVKYTQPFQRNVMGRQSVRMKKTSRNVFRTHSLSQADLRKNPRKLTSVDLELDLKASETRLTLLREDIDRLKRIKEQMEQEQKNNNGEIPAWFLENDQLQAALNESSGDRKMRMRAADRGNGRTERKMRRIQQQTASHARSSAAAVSAAAAVGAAAVVAAAGGGASAAGSTNAAPQYWDDEDSNDLQLRDKMAYFMTVKSGIPSLPFVDAGGATSTTSTRDDAFLQSHTQTHAHTSPQQNPPLPPQSAVSSSARHLKYQSVPLTRSDSITSEHV